MPLRARKSDNYRYRDNFRKEAIKKEAKTDTKNYAKRIKNDDFTRSNRKMSNIAKNEWLDGTIIISYFSGSNNIFADFNI